MEIQKHIEYLRREETLVKINISSWFIFLTKHPKMLCPQFYAKDGKLQIIIFTTMTCTRIYEGIFKPDLHHPTSNLLKWITRGKVLDKYSLKKSIIIKFETLTTFTDDFIQTAPCHFTCFLGLLNTGVGNNL